MLFLPPAGLSEGLTLLWITIGLFSFYTALTGYLVPSQALGAELTDDHHDRSRVFGLRGAFFTMGMVYAFGGMQYVMNSPDPRVALGPVVGAIAFVEPGQWQWMAGLLLIAGTAAGRGGGAVDSGRRDQL